MTAQQIKNQKIKETGRATRQRRKGLVCRVLEVKIVANKLSKEKHNHLDALFREAKWLRNAVIASDDIFTFDINAKRVTVKVGDVFEERDLVTLGSQMRQDAIAQVKQDILNLSALKKSGGKAGALKYKSYCNMVALRQFGTTYRIDRDASTVTIQGLRKPIKVRGLEQIPVEAEIANAKLVRKPSGYYFHITTYTAPRLELPTGKSVGGDFGIGTNITLSTGEEINISVPETKAVKRASRAVNRGLVKNGGKKRVRNHHKRKRNLRAAYEKLKNRKRDMSNKVTSMILRNHDFVAIQDEMIANWHKGLFGKQVQHSAMGSIKRKLKTNSKTHVVERSFPSTQKCPMCGLLTKHPLDQRYYECSHCGYYHPSRDVKSAATILMEAMQQVCAERTAKSPVEVVASTYYPYAWSFAHIGVVGKQPPVKQEAQVL